MTKEKVFVLSKKGKKKNALVLEAEKFGSIWVLWAYGVGRLIPEKTTEMKNPEFEIYLKRLEKYYSIIKKGL